MKNKMLTRNGWYEIEGKESYKKSDGTIEVTVNEPYTDGLNVNYNAVELNSDELNELEQAVSPHCISDSFDTTVKSVAYKVQEAINIYKLLSKSIKNSVLVDIQVIKQYMR